jgi:hypothetical protein
MPKRSRGEGYTRVRKAQSTRKSAKVSRRDKVLEGPKGQEIRFWHRQFNPSAEPSHVELQQTRVKMGMAKCDHRKDKTRGLSPHRSSKPKLEYLWNADNLRQFYI